MYRFSPIYLFLITILLVISTAGSLPPYDDAPDLIMILFCIFIWQRVLVTPYKIFLDDDNSIIFKSIVKRHIVFPEDIIKIEESLWSYKIILVNGHISISTLMERAAELKGLIKRLNENVTSEDIHLKEMERAEKKHPLTILLWAFLIIAIFLFLHL